MLSPLHKQKDQVLESLSDLLRWSIYWQSWSQVAGFQNPSSYLEVLVQGCNVQVSSSSQILLSDSWTFLILTIAILLPRSVWTAFWLNRPAINVFFLVPLAQHWPRGPSVMMEMSSSSGIVLSSVVATSDVWILSLTCGECDWGTEIFILSNLNGYHIG